MLTTEYALWYWCFAAHRREEPMNDQSKRLTLNAGESHGRETVPAVPVHPSLEADRLVTGLRLELEAVRDALDLARRFTRVDRSADWVATARERLATAREWWADLAVLVRL
jgi:hypothetical protein